MKTPSHMEYWNMTPMKKGWHKDNLIFQIITALVVKNTATKTDLNAAGCSYLIWNNLIAGSCYRTLIKTDMFQMKDTRKYKAP